MKISILVCIKDEELFIEEFLLSLERNELTQCEIIIVDDNSTDTTYEIIRNFIKGRPYFTLLRNPGKGKIDALNFGYQFVNGEVLKLLDGDDILDKDLIKKLRLHHADHSICTHDFVMFYPDGFMRMFNMGEVFFRMQTRTVIWQMKSLPKVSWSFSREVFENIFPIPPKIPYEDIWISLSVKVLLKKYNHHHINDFLYFYRQHENQTYGGVTNYSREKTQWRAQRNAKAAYEILKSKFFLKYEQELKEALLIQEFLSGQCWFPIKLVKNNPIYFFKIIVLKYCPQIFAVLAYFKFQKYTDKSLGFKKV